MDESLSADSPVQVFLSGLDSREIAQACGLEESYRAKQLYSWIAKGASSFEAMTNLPQELRSLLEQRFGGLRSSSVSSALEDEDGSLKLQIRLKDGAAVECVLLEDIEGRKTACLSSQVGCPMGCQFCRTGSLGFLRDLGPDEIMEQFYFLKERRGFISNVVFMGMGEPLLNLRAVRKAVALLSDPEGIGMSLRKITISTSGIVPGILDLAEHGPRLRLAVSLTTADEALRTELMPVNKRWDLSALKAALLEYQAKTRERITLELVLLGDRNADRESAEKLLRWIGPLKAQVNIIPWNSVPGLPFKEPTKAQLKDFSEHLASRGLVCVQRMHRGRGVMGACGQLGDTLRADR
jgi:23S rRNA (adenine2503-C2)-methyltransferase